MGMFVVVVAFGLVMIGIPGMKVMGSFEVFEPVMVEIVTIVVMIEVIVGGD